MNAATVLGGSGASFGNGSNKEIRGLNSEGWRRECLTWFSTSRATVRSRHAFGAINISIFGVLQVNAIIADNPSAPTGGPFTAVTTTGSNAVTLSAGTTANIFPGATVTGLAGETGTQIVTGIIDSTHFTVGVNAAAGAGSATATFTDHTSITKTGGGLLDLGDGNNNVINNSFSGFTTVNGGTLLVKSDVNFGIVPGTAVPNAITLNGGEIRSTAGFTINANRGIFVGPQGGTITYDGGANVQRHPENLGNRRYDVLAPFQIKAPPPSSLQPLPAPLPTRVRTTLATKTGSNILFNGVSQELPSTTPLTIAAYQGAFGTVNFNNTAQTIGSLASAVGVGTITNIGGLTIGGTTLNPVSQTATYNGTISGNNLTKNGGGTQTLTVPPTPMQAPRQSMAGPCWRPIPLARPPAPAPWSWLPGYAWRFGHH